MTALSPEDLAKLADVAVRAAVEAGQMIAQTRPQTVEHKEGGATLASQVVTEIDRASEVIILDLLNPTLERFELGLLTEESPDDGGRLTADYFWCIDPLDGTLPFIEGRPGYSVSIALVRRDGAPQIGVVYDPIEATTYHAIAAGGLYRNGHAWVPSETERSHRLSVLVTSGFAKRADHEELLVSLDELAHSMGLAGTRIDLAEGAVMKACSVLRRPPACFLMVPGPTGASLWDFAATACLFNEAGASATSFAGQPLELNRPESTNMGDGGVLFATDAALAADIRAVCSE